MSDLLSPIPIFLNVDDKWEANSDGSKVPTPRTVYIGTKNIYQCHLIRQNGEAFAPDSLATWLFAAHYLYDKSPCPVASDSAGGDFNIVGDWSLLNVADGLISWRADWTPAALATALAASTGGAFFCNLWMLTAHGNALLAHWDIIVHDVIVNPSVAAAVKGITHVTTDLLNQVLADILTPAGGNYRIRNGIIEKRNPTQDKWQATYPDGAAGQEHIAFGAPTD